MSIDIVKNWTKDKMMMLKPDHRIWGFVATAAVCIGLTGCGKSANPVNPVHGQVRVDGKPAARVMVALHPVHPAGPTTIHPLGQTDDNGTFTLTSFSSGDGAPEGEYQVTAVWLVPSQTKTHSDSEDTSTRNLLPLRYAAAETSKLKVTIAKGENTLPVIDLKSR